MIQFDHTLVKLNNIPAEAKKGPRALASAPRERNTPSKTPLSLSSPLKSFLFHHFIAKEYQSLTERRDNSSETRNNNCRRYKSSFFENLK